MNAFPKTNPIHDLLSFLIAEKYKEPLNKPTIVKPEAVKPEVVSTEPETKPSPAISRFSESLATLEKSRRLSIDSVSSSATSDPSQLPKPKYNIIRFTPEERAETTAENKKRGLHKPTTGPVANILSTLQETPQQEAGGIGNVDFQ